MKFNMKRVIASVIAMVSLSAGANAAFTKINTYADGTFSDVKKDAWYAKDVASAYELGFMNGTGSGKFSPDGNVTVAEAITMASRVNAIANGKTIAEKQGAKNWYDMYVDYAVANGLIAKDTFENYNRNAMRYEVAALFAKSMPASHFTAKNDIKDIPDVAETEEYYDALMMLYKAGVVTGSNEYGDFFATNSIKRSETAAIINRVALPGNRKSAVLKEYGNRDQAVYLISDYSMSRKYKSGNDIASGWTYENTGLTNVVKRDYSSNNLVDVSDKHTVTARKNVAKQTSGKIVFESKLTISGNGANILFEDSERNILFGITVEDGRYKAIGKATVDTGVSIVSENHRFYMVLDLDAKKTTVVLNGKEIGTYDMSDSKELASVAYKTSENSIVTMGLLETYMYTQYAVNDTFRIAAVGEKLYGWNTSENVSVQKQASDYDAMSAEIKNTGSASKKFDAVKGKFVYETFVKLPKNQKASLELKNGDKSAVRVDISDGKVESNGKVIRECDTSRWTLVRIEGDTDTGKALVRVNGKREGTQVSLSEKSVDTVAVSFEGTGSFWFDDVQLYNVYDFADYVPKPEPVNNDGYYLGMNICSLWRDGSHYGWDCISPYDDIQPVLGYYDEGLPEVADWEIKFLSEHGYDFENFCWYYTKSRFADGIKEPTMGFALHDGYMNAKYSDMVKFAILWENGFSEDITKDSFYNEIWPYWCEWYLSDSRYMKIGNKAVITILSDESFIKQMGSVDDAKEVIDFIRKDIKKLGYDGAIILGAVVNSMKDTANAEKIGIDAFIAYHLGENGYEPDHQKKVMNSAFESSKLPLLASVGIGFNDIGWTEQRTPLATADAHKSIFEWAKSDYMPRLAKREDWMGKLAVANTWNEYGEGHYIFPTNLNKFGYLDAARQVFSTASGKNDNKHFDIVPTDNQKARLGYLYQAQTIPLRRTHYISDDDAIAGNKVIKVWDFENESDCAKWSTLVNTTTPVKYDPTEKALVAQTLKSDAHIKMNNLPENYFNADEVRYIHIQMKTDAAINTSMELYYLTEEGYNWAYEKRATATVPAEDGYVDYYLDMQGKSGWKGTIKSMRFDPVNTMCTFYIKKIELLSEKSENGYTVRLGNTDFNFNSNFVKKAGDEVYIGANPSEGFYSLSGFYYEWNRWNGFLMIRTNTGHQFDFAVGSNKVLVDGKEKTISERVELVDGLPMLPILFIYDNAEYNYEKTDSGIKLNVGGVDVEAAIKARKSNEYEFSIPGDNEGWIIYGGIGGVIDGGMMYIEAVGSAGKYSPHMCIYGTKINTSDYNRIEVRIKPAFKNTGKNNVLSVYFATQEQPSADEAKRVKLTLDDYKPDAEGFYTVTFDMSGNENWKTNATQIRFDCPGRWGSYYIDYVKILPDPNKKPVQNTPSQISVGETVASVNFGSKDMFMIFNVGDASVNGSLSGTALTADPNIVYKKPLNLNAGEIGAIKVVARIPKGKTAEIYFTTQEGFGFSNQNRFRFTSESDDFETYIIDTSTCSTWKGNICEIRFDPFGGTGVEGLAFEYKSVELCKLAESGESEKEPAVSAGEALASVSFDDKSKFMIFHMDNVSVNGSFKGTALTSDPNFIYREKINLSASQIKYIKVVAKIPKGKTSVVYFTTEEGLNFSNQNSFKFTSESDDFATYVIDTSTCSTWKGNICEIRFDPVGGTGAEGLEFECKSIEFCK